MKRVLAGLATAVAAVLTLSACGNSNPLSSPSSGGQAPADTLTIGSERFPESHLLAEIYAQALEAKGVKVERKLDLGPREVYYPAIKEGSIDLVPEYTGTLLQHLNKQAPETQPDEVYEALKKTLPPELIVLNKAAAEDKDAVVVSKETAAKWNLKSIADLTPHCGESVFGGPPELAQRPDGIPGFAKNYQCTFKEFKPLEPGAITTKALLDNTVQAADIFTTDASIAANGFVVLADPKSNFAAQNVVPLIRQSKASDNVKAVLNSIAAKLDLKALQDLNNKLNAADKPDYSDVAKAWVASAGI
jgi:osmoprotectant transport system substrate-binding protein